MFMARTFAKCKKPNDFASPDFLTAEAKWYVPYTGIEPVIFAFRVDITLLQIESGTSATRYHCANRARIVELLFAAEDLRFCLVSKNSYIILIGSLIRWHGASLLREV